MRRTVWMYLVGALVLLAACGGTTSTSSSTVAGGSSPTTTATHTAEPGEPEITSVTGYEYASPSSDITDPVNQIVEGMPQAYATYSVHEVTKDGETIGYLVLLGVTQKFAKIADENPAAVVGGAAGGMVGSGASSVDMQTISGEQVAIASAQGTTAYAWYHNQAVSMLLVDGGTSPAATDFLEQYLATANAL